MKKMKYWFISKSLTVCIVLILLATSCSRMKEDNTVEETVVEDSVVIAYYANFAGLRPVSTISLDGVNYINHASIYPHSTIMIDDTIVTKDSRAVINRAGLKVKVMINIGTLRKASMHLGIIASKPETTRRFADSLVSFCHRYKYAGVDLDWETPTQEQASDYERFVRIVNERLDTNKLLFSITLPGQYYKTHYLNYKVLSENVDWINIMTYDFGNQSTNKIMHNTPLAEIKSNVDSFLNYVPKNKLVLGLAFYGRIYKKAESFKIGSKAEREAWLYPIDSIMPKLNDLGWEKDYDKVQEVPFMYNTSRRQFISYDDSVSLNKKCSYVLSFGLKGVMYWAMDYDAKDYSNSYQKIVGEAFKK